MPETDVTALLTRWSSGDRQALDELTPLVYSELRAIAARHLRLERERNSLQTTQLAHEAYLKLVDQTHTDWRNRAHFLGVAAEIIRRILVDHARARGRQKRGGGLTPLALDEALHISDEKSLELIALDDALSALAQLDERQSRLVELRFFAGLSLDETAEVMRISRATAGRDWATARAWLIRELGAASAPQVG